MEDFLADINLYRCDCFVVSFSIKIDAEIFVEREIKNTVSPLSPHSRLFLYKVMNQASHCSFSIGQLSDTERPTEL